MNGFRFGRVPRCRDGDADRQGVNVLEGAVFPRFHIHGEKTDKPMLTLRKA
jgi:hypothetical protein